jgi:CheY-like chemotaxis protein
MNGIELAGVIKARPNPPAVVVIINAGRDAEFERQCAAAGADFCVEKRRLQARLLACPAATILGSLGRRRGGEENLGALRGASSTPHPAARRRAAWFLAQPEEPQDSDDDDDCADDVDDAVHEIIFRVGSGSNQIPLSTLPDPHLLCAGAHKTRSLQGSGFELHERRHIRGASRTGVGTCGPPLPPVIDGGPGQRNGRSAPVCWRTDATAHSA